MAFRKFRVSLIIQALIGAHIASYAIKSDDLFNVFDKRLLEKVLFQADIQVSIF